MRWTSGGSVSIEGTLMPTPEWAREGYVRFRPDFGGVDMLVPKAEIEPLYEAGRE